MEDSSEGQQTVNLTGLSRQTLLYEVDDQPTLRRASFARGLTDPFVERTGKRDVLPYVRRHSMIIHTEIRVVRTVVLGETIDKLDAKIGTRGVGPRLPLQLHPRFARVQLSRETGRESSRPSGASPRGGRHRRIAGRLHPPTRKSGLHSLVYISGRKLDRAQMRLVGQASYLEHLGLCGEQNEDGQGRSGVVTPADS